jgi:hypothetical protein
MKIGVLSAAVLLVAAPAFAQMGRVQGRVWCYFEKADQSDSMTDTSCYATGQNPIGGNPGWIELQWSDGVQNRIDFVNMSRTGERTYEGTARIDGELADMSIGQIRTCLTVRSNHNQVCFWPAER